MLIINRFISNFSRRKITNYFLIRYNYFEKHFQQPQKHKVSVRVLLVSTTQEFNFQNIVNIRRTLEIKTGFKVVEGGECF